MLIKKIISCILIILCLSINTVYAQDKIINTNIDASTYVQSHNWVTITAENGKTADLDLDSIQMAVDTVEYDIRMQIKDYIYINRFSTELYKENTPTAVIRRKKYKNSISEENKIEDEIVENREYRELKQGTLQSEIFDVLSKEFNEKEFKQGTKIWNKYLKKQRQILYKQWEPRYKWFDDSRWSSDFTDISELQLTIDADGNVVNKNESYKESLPIIKIDPLPEDYTANTFYLNVKTEYFKYAGSKLASEKPSVKQISPVNAQINIAKTQRPPVIGHIEYGILRAFYAWDSFLSNAADALTDNYGHPFFELFVFFPVWVAGGILGGCVKVMIGFLFLLTGGDWNDL